MYEGYLVVNQPRRVSGAMVPVRWCSTSHFLDPWNCPCSDVCCMKPSGSPRFRFCSQGSETEDFGIQRQETGILYSRNTQHMMSKCTSLNIKLWPHLTHLKSKKSKAVIVSKTANWSISSFKIITILWMRVLTLSMLRSSRTWWII